MYSIKQNSLIRKSRLILLPVITFISPIIFADHASPSFETGTAGAVNTLSAATLPKNKLVFGISTQFIEFDDIPNQRLEDLAANDNEVHSVDSLFSLSVNVAYGLTDNFTIGISLPYIDRQNITEGENKGAGVGEAEFAGNSNGISDLKVFSQYRFLRTDTTDIAALLGIKMPSGDTDQKELGGNAFEAEQQPGSGSWDPFFGLSFNRSWGNIGISSNILYTVVTEGTQDTSLGDIFNYNIAASYRAIHVRENHNHKHHSHDNGIVDYMDLVLELNGDHREQVEIRGVDDINTGGNIIYISPGMRIGLGHRWSVYSSFGIPVVNDLDGIQSESDFRITAGISTVF